MLLLERGASPHATAKVRRGAACPRDPGPGRGGNPGRRRQPVLWCLLSEEGVQPPSTSAGGGSGTLQDLHAVLLLALRVCVCVNVRACVHACACCWVPQAGGPKGGLTVVQDGSLVQRLGNQVLPGRPRGETSREAGTLSVRETWARGTGPPQAALQEGPCPRAELEVRGSRVPPAGDPGAPSASETPALGGTCRWPAYAGF